MKVADVMTRDVRVIEPHRTVREAARLMDDMNVGVLPVCDGRRLLGMITDRDIAVRSTATGVAPDRHHVEEIMSRSLQWCFEDDDAHEVLMHMSEKQIRRMPVVDDDRRLVGIVALGDFATDNAPGVREALQRISTPSEPDRTGTPTTARADRTRDQSGSPLSEEEQRELERRRRAPAQNRDSFGGGASDVGPPQGELDWRREADRGFRFREEDDRRATFAGGFNEGYGEGEGEGPGRMRGGYGGEGYSNYGADYGEGAQGGGAGGPGYFGDYGSYRDGTPRRWGSEGEEDYDRGMVRGREGRSTQGGIRFSNETAEYRRDQGRHHGKGPKGYTRSDQRIREDVCERLMEDPHVDASEIDVRVENGEVTLTGTVPNRSDKRRAEVLVDRVRGIRHVQNNLRAQPRSGAGDRGDSGLAEGIRTTGETGIAGTQIGTGGGGTVSGAPVPRIGTAGAAGPRTEGAMPGQNK